MSDKPTEPRRRTSLVLVHPAATGATPFQEFCRRHNDYFKPELGWLDEWLPCRHKRHEGELWCHSCKGKDGQKTVKPPTWQGH